MTSNDAAAEKPAAPRTDADTQAVFSFNPLLVDSSSEDIPGLFWKIHRASPQLNSDPPHLIIVVGGSSVKHRSITNLSTAIVLIDEELSRILQYVRYILR